MSEQANVCEFCREHGPRWIRWLDRSVADYMRRVHMGGIGPTAYALRFCDNCRDRAEAEYPSGNAASLERIARNAEGLDADDNQIRAIALMMELTP